MARRQYGSLAPLRNDLKELALFLLMVDPGGKTRGWYSRLNVGGLRLDTYAQVGRSMVRHLADLICDCRQLPHTESCCKIRAVEMEFGLQSKWGFTRYLDVGEIPYKVKELGNAKPIGDPDVLPFRLPAG